MNPHRQHTFDIPSNSTPIEQVPYRRDDNTPAMPLGPLALLVAVSLACGLALAAITYASSAPTVVISPVHQAHAEPAPLEPTQLLDGAQLAQIRVEAFRAGMESAQQNCFGAPPLSAPIAPQQ